MSLKVSVSTPISSREATSIFWEKSPSATRLAPSVSRSMGVIMVLDSRKDSSTEITRPKTRASMISSEELVCSGCDTVALLSRI